jgi:hypothetical protein
VKDHNDFNDSSWLARLVNGLEEGENVGAKPLAEISNLISVASSQINKKLANLEHNNNNNNNNNNTNRNTNNTEPKATEETPKTIVRKSVPTIPSYRCPKGLKENHKPNHQPQPIPEL